MNAPSILRGFCALQRALSHARLTAPATPQGFGDIAKQITRVNAFELLIVGSNKDIFTRQD
jgi:hypothetical protein